MDPDKGVRSLARKVQFDIRFFFARRGAENMHKMTKDLFKLVTDVKSGLRYIVKVMDEETKYHKSIDDEITTAQMPEIAGHKLCPVSSFLKYLNALSPKSDKLWQTPKYDCYPDDQKQMIWFYGSMGHNKLDAFVSDLAYACGIERGTCSNHSLHHTAITNFKRAKLSDKQVMSVTGHNSACNLDIYQKVDSEEKLKMGMTMAKLLTSDSNPEEIRHNVDKQFMSYEEKSKQRKQQISATMHNPIVRYEIPKEPEEPIPSKSFKNSEADKMLLAIPDYNNLNNSPQMDTNFDLSDQDIVKILEDCEQENQHLMMTQQVSTTNKTTEQILAKKSSPRIPIFNNCHIAGNITININKN